MLRLSVLERVRRLASEVARYARVDVCRSTSAAGSPLPSSAAPFYGVGSTRLQPK